MEPENTFAGFALANPGLLTPLPVRVGWYAIDAAHYREYSDSFVHEANHLALARFLSLDEQCKWQRVLYRNAGSILVNGAWYNDEIAEALLSLSDYPCLDDDLLGELEANHADEYIDSGGLDDILYTLLRAHGISRLDVEELPQYRDLWEHVQVLESTPQQVVLALADNAETLTWLFDSGLRLTVEGIATFLASPTSISQEFFLVVRDSHRHFTDDELGLSSECRAFLLEHSARNNQSQIKLFKGSSD